METVAAETQQNIVSFLKVEVAACFVRRPLPDRKLPEHQALVRCRVQVVQLRGNLREP